MPPSERPIPCFMAEPPQEPLPYGRWAEALGERFLEGAAGLQVEEGELGELGEPAWFPERTLHGRTYVPATVPSAAGFEVFGYVSYAREDQEAQPADFRTVVDYTEETAAANPEWTLDLSDQRIGSWRGPRGRRGLITLVWGVALVAGGVLATAELGPTTTDQSELVEDRFTLVSLDDYTGDYVEVRLYDRRGGELARESLYEEE